MSCRSTNGGRVACMHATMLGVPSTAQSALLHRLARDYEAEHAEATESASPDEVLAFFDQVETRCRHLPGVSDTKRERLLSLLSRARNDVAAGDLPSRATLSAWESLPSAGEAETRRQRERPRPYHLRFRNFDKRTIAATDALFSARPSRLSHEERDVAFRQWVEEVSDVYGMEPPSFEWSDDADDCGGGFYRPSDHSITMSRNHPSVTTLLHEFRHALQGANAGAPQVDSDVEVDARAWSLSLYHQVRPQLFDRMVRAGRIFHISANDLDR